MTKFLFKELVKSLKALELTKEQTFSNTFNTVQVYVVKRFQLLDLY